MGAGWILAGLLLSESPPSLPPVPPESAAADDSAPRAAPAADRPVRRLGAYGISGAAAGGWRFLDVNGDREQYEEDFRLDRGPVLLELRLEGERVEGTGGPDSFLLLADGIGDPASLVRAEAVFGELRAVGRYQRSVYSGNTSSDIHPFDVEREQASLGLSHGALGGGSTKADLSLDYFHREGLTVGDRQVGWDVISGFPVYQDDRRLGARAGAIAALGEVRLELASGLEWATGQNRQSFAEPSPSYPDEIVSEDLDADTKGLRSHGEVRLRRPLRSGKVEIDAGLGWQAGDQDGDLQIFEEGFFFDPDSPYRQWTEGRQEFAERSVQIDIGVRHGLDDQRWLELRYSRRGEEEHGRLVSDILLDEFLGDPSEWTTVNTFDLDSSLDLLEAGIENPLGPWAHLDLQLDVGREDLEIAQIADGVGVRVFEDEVGQVGGQGTISFDAGRDWSVEASAGHETRSTPTSRVGTLFTVDDTRARFVSASSRWRPSARCAVRATARHERRTSRAFENAEAISDAFSLSASATPRESLSLDGSFTYRTSDRTSDTNFVILDGFPTVVDGVATFEAVQRILSGSLSLEITDSLHSSLAAAAVLSGGDADFDYSTAWADLAYRLDDGWEMGIRASWTDFDAGSLLVPSAYDARMAMLYLRTFF
ncbi:MAG: hypothetical protein AB1726_14840 [Planctomycetota bacterium]